MLFRHRRPPPRRAVVTGASSGIGRAFARELAGDADLLLTGRDAPALEELAAELRAAAAAAGEGREREVRVVTADLAVPAERAELIAAATAFEPDLLVNDAGLGTWGEFLEDPPDRVEASVLVDVLAPVVLARALLPGMIERAAATADGGRAGLINLSSTLAFTPVPQGSVYGASKAFLLAFTEALAAELGGRPIDVLAVCPGPVRTDFYRRAGFPGGPPPFAYAPERVARRALADLGRHTVSFGDLPSALLLRPVTGTRMGLGRTFALGTRALRAWRGRAEPEPEAPRGA
jgi:short-subunit dehydrogenase